MPVPMCFCIDSSEGLFWMAKLTLDWVPWALWNTVKVGAVVLADAEGFPLFGRRPVLIAMKVGIGGGSYLYYPRTRVLGRGQATALIEVAKARDEYYKETE